MGDNKGMAATRAKNKYNAENYDRLYPFTKKGRKAVYEKAAEKYGMTLNEFIIVAIEEKTEKTLENERQILKMEGNYRDE